MEGVHDEHIGMGLDDFQKREGKMLHPFSETLSAMGRDENHPIGLWVQVRKIECTRRLAIQVTGRVQQGVNDCVPCHEHGVTPDPLGQKIVCGPPGRAEVEIRYMGDAGSVYLLGIRLKPVVRAQSCFHVAHGNPEIEGGKRCCKCRGRVALDYHQVGALPEKDSLHTLQHCSGDMEKALIFLEYVEVVIRPDLKKAQKGIDQLAMLAGQSAHKSKPIRSPLEFLVKRAELNSFRSGAEHHKH
jgi:hypothetical protein